MSLSALSLSCLSLFRPLLTGLLFLLRAPRSVFAVLLRIWRCLQSWCSQKWENFRSSRKLQGLSMVNFTCVSSVLNLAAEFGVQELLGTVSSSKQMPIRGFTGVQKVIASLISSELSFHQTAIRSHLGVRPPQLSSNHFGVFGPTGCVHRGLHSHTTGSGPVRGVPPARHVPLLCLSLFPPLVSRSWYRYV